MASGVVIRLKVESGYGFIREDGAAAGRSDRSGGELFFHRSALEPGAFESLDVGTPVTFDVGRSPKGPRAENVRITDS